MMVPIAFAQKKRLGNPTKYAQVDGRWLRVRPSRPANAAPICNLKQMLNKSTSTSKQQIHHVL